MQALIRQLVERNGNDYRIRRAVVVDVFRNEEDAAEALRAMSRGLAAGEDGYYFLDEVSEEEATSWLAAQEKGELCQ